MVSPGAMNAENLTKTLRARAKDLYWALPAKREVFELVRRVTVPPRRIRDVAKFRGEFTIDVDGKPLRLHSEGGSIERELFWLGIEGFEWESLRLWQTLARRSSVIFDIGANMGLYSLLAKTVNPSARVHAFEPAASVAKHMKRNCALNAFDVQVNTLALSNREGEATFYEAATGNDLGASLEPRGALGWAELREVKVPVTTLRHYVESNGIERIDLMKIDVERHEIPVLEGMGELLGKMRPTIVIEVLDTPLGDALARFLEPLGYSFFHPTRSGAPQRVERMVGSDVNYLACQPEIARELGALG